MAPTLDWKSFYSLYDGSREDAKKRRAAGDAQARSTIGGLVGGVESEAYANAEKGRDWDAQKGDITRLDSYQPAAQAMQQQEAKRQQSQTAAAPWEGWLGMQRGEGEGADPWGQLSQRLGAVQQGANRRNIQTRQQQGHDEQQRLVDDFNRKQRELRANDGDNRREYERQQSEWVRALGKYGEEASLEATQGRGGRRRESGVTTSAWGAAMADCEAGRGPCPPNSALLNANQNTAGGQLNDAQRELQRRLGGIREDPGFYYGTNLADF